MNPTQPLASDPTIDPELVAAVGEWSPRGVPRPAVDLEARPDGVRVRLTYLGVETGVLFAHDSRVIPTAVHGALDRVFEVLSWRVTRPRS